MRRSTAVLVVLLVILVGLCIFDRDDDGIGDGSVDKCVALTAAVVAVEVVVLGARRSSSAARCGV